MNVTDSAGIEICRKHHHVRQEDSAIKHELDDSDGIILNLGISAKDFGVETDPVIRDEHLALI